ncbi:hypothetical protein MKX03_001694 [Papaver bracteatum]|nr:hypothetical protein MKX03_001694 [Papaver bracteatum]
MLDDDYNNDTDFNDDECGDVESDIPQGKELSYTSLKEEDVRKRQQEDVTQTSTVLSIPIVAATMLLRHYNWKVIDAQDAWYANEEQVRRDVGLLEMNDVVPIQNATEKIIKCKICFDEFERDGMCAEACGHLFCNWCWKQYVSIKISDGPGCLGLRCPEPSCRVAVGQDMVNQLVSDEDKEKYSRYLLRSYVEDQKNIKWCPGAGCECSVEFFAGSSSYDVVCSCLHNFRWNCLDDAHRPVDCDTVHKWAVKNTAESENVTWILANSKSCPKCKRPIQKNEGCMHMTCSCRYEFCWLCLGDWKTHGTKQVGFMRVMCMKKQDHKEQLKSLQETQSEYLAVISDRYDVPETELTFITDAWLQIIECRRVLKWTYAYGYYLPKIVLAKKKFFEYLQGEAESALEKLHNCAEKDLHPYLKENGTPEDVIPFRVKLARLTSVTRTYFENLVRALENGLSDYS